MIEAIHISQPGDWRLIVLHNGRRYRLFGAERSAWKGELHGLFERELPASSAIRDDTGLLIDRAAPKLDGYIKVSAATYRFQAGSDSAFEATSSDVKAMLG